MRCVVVKDWLGVRLGRKQLLFPRHVSNNNNKMVNSGYQMASIETGMGTVIYQPKTQTSAQQNRLFFFFRS